MGRQNRHPSRGGKHLPPDEAAKVLDRIGMNNTICQSCNANNPEDAEVCRKCGDAELRPKRRDFADA